MTIEDRDPTQRQPAMDDATGLREARATSGGRAFEGSVEFAQALKEAMAHASERATRRLCWCDEDFASWPIGEADWVAQGWAHDD